MCKRILLTPMLVLVVFGLAACSDDFGAPISWVGVGQTSSSTYAVKLVYTVYGNALFGTYYLRNPERPDGKAEGTIDGDAIAMALPNSTTCTFDFGGTITGTRLTGAFVPREGCSLLTQSGTRDLARQ